MPTFVVGDIHGRAELLNQLIRDVPWDVRRDKIVFLGDLIDRGAGGPQVIERVMRLVDENPNIVVLRGNHEQMMLDFFDRGDLSWLMPENGGIMTLAAYGADLAELTEALKRKDVFRLLQGLRVPKSHIEFMRGLPLYHEDDFAIYVHAGLVPGLHPSQTDAEVLIWSRSRDFFLGYRGKLCFFGHTPTQYLPKEGRLGRCGIYMYGDCVGLDTSGDEASPLSCIRADTFTLYQAHPSGVTEVHRLARLS